MLGPIYSIRIINLEADFGANIIFPDSQSIHFYMKNTTFTTTTKKILAGKMFLFRFWKTDKKSEKLLNHLLWSHIMSWKCMILGESLKFNYLWSKKMVGTVITLAVCRRISGWLLHVATLLSRRAAEPCASNSGRGLLGISPTPAHVESWAWNIRSQLWLKNHWKVVIN